MTSEITRMTGHRNRDIPLAAIWLVLELIASSSLACAHGSPDAGRVYKICDLVASGSQIDGKKVRIHAVYVQQAPHGGFFSDPSCSQEQVSDYTPIPRKPNLESFYAEPFTEDKQVRQFVIDAVGTVRGGNAGLSFELEKIWNYRRIEGDWRSAELD